MENANKILPFLYALRAPTTQRSQHPQKASTSHLIIIIIMSSSVVKYRLKHGQCIHCGNQTHQVVKKMFKTTERIPLTVPGCVQNGSCLRVDCLKAGNNNVVIEDSTSKPPTRMSGQKIAKVTGPVVSGAGAVMSVLGVPGGELLSAAGNKVSSLGGGSSHHTASTYNDSFSSHGCEAAAVANSHAKLTNIMANYDQTCNQIKQNQQAAVANSQANLTNILANCDQTCNQIKQNQQAAVANSQANLANIMANYNQQMQQIKF
jgi:hypothetical protein